MAAGNKIKSQSILDPSLTQRGESQAHALRESIIDQGLIFDETKPITK
jgi:broad specificity phosphatase PhoE